MPRSSKLKVIVPSVLCAALLAAPAFIPVAEAQTGAMAGAAHMSPLGDLSQYKTIAEDALTLAQKGDFAGAHKKMKEFEATWDNHEDSHKKKSYNTWKSIDNQLDLTLGKLEAKAPDKADCEKALQGLIAKLG
ncbi:MAG: histidine kinase [Proteobacteria bacterium]|jgi:hypothetical protein|nr:histidine kinase [Pseudomonadota bacterium]